MSLPELTAGEWRLRGWLDQDAPAVQELARDRQAWQWMPSLRQVAASGSAAEWLTRRREPGRWDWAATDPVTRQVVGRVGLHHHRPEDRRAEIGYAVWPQWRGRGVASALVDVATRFGFGELGLHRIALYHAVGNVASCRVAARCGFAYEGVERQALDHGDGVWHDEHRHARLATDPSGPADPAPADPEPVPPATITTHRFLLRPPTAGDAEGMLPVLADRETARWNPVPPPVDLDRARRWCRTEGDWTHGRHATFVAIDRTTGAVAGNVALHSIDRESGDAEIGYRVAPAARGQGVATELLLAVTRWAFDALGLHRVHLVHAADNPPSCRVAEKAGYRLEGVTRQSYRYGDGRRHDEHLHARLAADPEPDHQQPAHPHPAR